MCKNKVSLLLCPVIFYSLIMNGQSLPPKEDAGIVIPIVLYIENEMLI